jgi:ubiquitin-conjugating enzyme E2 Z
MAAAATSRLMSEAREMASQSIPVVFAQPDEHDIHHWHAMILAPPETPYSLGLFHFDMRFPADYPNSAPKVLITTTSGGHVRFNPNLYASGKVCLSILGTWRAEHSGEQWSAVQSVQSILLSIQSLMHDAPYHNEPSFEVDDGSGDPQRYNDKIAHETLRVAICEVMEDTLEQRPVSANGVTPLFAQVRKCLFRMYAERHAAHAARMSERDDLKDGTAFPSMPFETPSNGIHGSYGWSSIKSRLDLVSAQLAAEVETWRKTGEEQTTMQAEHHDASVSSCIHYLRQQDERIKSEVPDGASIGPIAGNACVWEATIFGPSETLWESGIFAVEVVFPPDFPDSPPFVRFTTRMFHPHISPSGVPYLPSLLLWHCSEPKERTVGALLRRLVDLLKSEPSPEPATHLNVEAAALLFSRDEAERKEYRKRVTRAVQRSVDG